MLHVYDNISYRLTIELFIVCALNMLKLTLTYFESTNNMGSLWGGDAMAGISSRIYLVNERSQ